MGLNYSFWFFFCLKKGDILQQELIFTHARILELWTTQLHHPSRRTWSRHAAKANWIGDFFQLILQKRGSCCRKSVPGLRNTVYITFLRNPHRCFWPDLLQCMPGYPSARKRRNGTSSQLGWRKKGPSPAGWILAYPRWGWNLGLRICF